VHAQQQVVQALGVYLPAPPGKTPLRVLYEPEEALYRELAILFGPARSVKMKIGSRRVGAGVMRVIIIDADETPDEAYYLKKGYDLLRFFSNFPLFDLKTGVLNKSGQVILDHFNKIFPKKPVKNIKTCVE